MQKIHVARNNAVTGVFTEDEVRTGLQNGTLLLTDLAWTTGMPAWKALGQWSEFAAAENAGGAAPQPQLVPQTPPAPAEPVWERASRGGYWKAYWETVRDVLLNPTRTFAAMEKYASFGRAYVFVLIGTFISGAFSHAIQFLFGATLGPKYLDMLPLSDEQRRNLEPYFNNSLYNQQLGDVAAQSGTDAPIVVLQTVHAGALILGVIVGLAALAAAPIIMAGITHLFLMLFGGARRGYDATFRVGAYVQGTTSLFSWIPLVGSVAGIYALVLEIKGLAEVHGISRWRAAAAVLAPMFICICCFSVIIIWALSILANNPALPH